MNHQLSKNSDRLEQEKKRLVRQGNQQMTDEIKQAVDLAYKLSYREPPVVKLKTSTEGTFEK